MTSLNSSQRLAACTAVVIATLSLGACSQGGKDESASTTTAAPSTAAVTSSASPTTEAEATESAQAEAEGQQAQSEDSGQDVVPNPTLTASHAEDADVEAIRQTVVSLFNYDSTVKEYFSNFLTYTCKEKLGTTTIDQSMLDQMPNIKFKDSPQAAQLPSVTSVTNIDVEGTRATATMTVSGQGTTQSNEVTFVKEDGLWKLCS